MDLQSSIEFCKSLKSGPSGPFFVSAGTTEIHPGLDVAGILRVLYRQVVAGAILVA
jgi:hypothetical protein